VLVFVPAPQPSGRSLLTLQECKLAVKLAVAEAGEGKVRLRFGDGNGDGNGDCLSQGPTQPRPLRRQSDLR